MLNWLEGKKSLLISLFLLLALITFVTNLINIALESTNYKLSRDIEILEEEKNIIRAQYLGATAFESLNQKAQNLNMKAVADYDTLKVSQKAADIRLNSLAKSFLSKHPKKKSTQTCLRISAY